MGLEQAEYPPPSSWQVKLTPPSESENVKEAEVELVGSDGWGSMEGGGGAEVSTVQVQEVTPLVLPAGSRASTRKVCEPSEREE